MRMSQSSVVLEGFLSDRGQKKKKRGPTAESKHGGCRTEMNRLAWGLGFTLAVAVGLQARVIMVRVGIDCMCAGDGDQEAV